MTLARIFVVVAAILSLGCFTVAAATFLDGDPAEALLSLAVSVFAAWMATAIHQFQSRIAGMDELVRQARERAQQSERTLSEMRQLAERLRTAAPSDDGEEDHTIH